MLDIFSRFGLCLSAVLLSSSVVSAQDIRSLEDPVDRVAAEILNKAQSLSFRDKVEYCGLIGYGKDGTLEATQPRRGQRDGCQPDDDLSLAEVIASYHTHGSYSRDADAETPSVGDLEADFSEQIDGYVATPGGRLWVNLHEEKVSIQLCGVGCLKQDPQFRACPAFAPQESYTIRDLAEREELDDGSC